jgi:hypothetical protein
MKTVQIADLPYEPVDPIFVDQLERRIDNEIYLQV